MRPNRPTLCVIGGGKCEARLREQVAQLGLCGQVVLMGSQSHAAALGHLICARVMLLPSRWEGLPISIIEAMHRGIPVVASNVPGTSELIVDGETGFLVPAEDVDGYASRLRLLLDNEVLRTSMGTRALERARMSFSIEQQVNAHVALYSQVSFDCRAGGEE
jgi:glycosyltransferase involved in cell wall biosynthesis